MDRSSQCPSQNADSPSSLVRSHLSIIPHYRQPITFHKRRFSILIRPFLIDSCQSNDVTGDLHKFWTNQRPLFVLPHPPLLLIFIRSSSRVFVFLFQTRINIKIVKKKRSVHLVTADRWIRVLLKMTRLVVLVTV